MNDLVHFLSEFPFFQNEKNLFIHLEEFLAKQFLIRPLIVFSIDQNQLSIEISKCRLVLGKDDRLQLYGKHIIEECFTNRSDLKELPCLKVKIENCFYYYLNLGIKGNQFYFSFFSTPIDIDVEHLVTFSAFSKSHLCFVDKYNELFKNQELIHIDDVTGLYNQRKLFKDIHMLVDKSKADKDSFCVLFIDIDRFKLVNDNYGHLVGTRLLENVATDIKNLLRDTDYCYRYGGDEFVIILSDSDSISGKIVGERILKKIKSKDYPIETHKDAHKLSLSVSIGVAEYPKDAKSSDEILAIADRMMYEAKESGRGLVFNTQDVFKSSLKKFVDTN
jgi:diguanylate cyclase (GGDEF)-like protein